MPRRQDRVQESDQARPAPFAEASSGSPELSPDQSSVQNAEFHFTAAALPFFDQDHLMHVIARQSIGTGEQHAIQNSAFHAIPESVQTRTVQVRAAESVIP